MIRMRAVLIPVFGVLALAVPACSDSGNADTSTETSSSSQGDGDGDPTTTGDGDGDPTTTGDGDGDPTMTGDGDGEPGCTPGELNCECNDGLCLGDLECVDGVCVEDCIPGELGCECNGGQCLGDLECVDDVCTEPGGDGDGDGDGDPTTTGDGDGDNDFCPAPNEEWCDGMCVDVWSNNDNCGGCGVVCNVKYGGAIDVGVCVDGDCTPTWSECIPEDEGMGMSCDDICALSGQTCVQNACGIGDWTVMRANQLDSCNTGNGQESTAPCDFVLNWTTAHAGCCCTQ